jgi:hypothetical protein
MAATFHPVSMTQQKTQKQAQWKENQTQRYDPVTCHRRSISAKF